jgi:hypothetical protein
MELVRVRQYVLDTLSQLGFTQPLRCCESVLLRDGQAVGRTFYFLGVRAVWFSEDQRIEFYRDDGTELRIEIQSFAT